MQTLEDLSTIIQEFNQKVAEQSYNEAIALYYKQLNWPLYCSGENNKIIDLLSVFFDEKNDLLPSIDQSQQENILYTLANTYKITGQPKRAIALFEFLLHLHEGLEDYQDYIRSAKILRYLSRIKISLGELSSAEEHLNKAIELCRKIKEEGLETGMHRQRGILLAYEGRFEEADIEINYLPKNFGKHNHGDFSVHADRCLYTLVSKRKLGKAPYYANEMKKLIQKYPYKPDIVIAEWLLGLSYLHSNDLPRAGSHIDKAIISCKETNYLELEADILLAKARWYFADQKNIHMASKTAKEGLAIATRCEYKLKKAEIHNFLGKLALESGDNRIVEKHARTAHELAVCDGPPHHYKLSMVEAEETLKKLNIRPPIEFYSCFISYSRQDKPFVDRLSEALEIRDIEVWRDDDHKILPGDYPLTNIEEGIDNYDKVIIVCSKNSLTSSWVNTEIGKAIQKEKRLFEKHNRRVLVMIPLDIDGYLHKSRQDPNVAILGSRHSADFTGWEQDDRKFQDQFEKLMLALRADKAARGKLPEQKL